MSETVFLSLAPDLDANDFINEREAGLFEDIDDFVTRLQLPVETEGLSVDSSYFRAYGMVTQIDSSYPVTTLIYRDQDGNTQVVNRSLGSF